MVQISPLGLLQISSQNNLCPWSLPSGQFSGIRPGWTRLRKDETASETVEHGFLKPSKPANNRPGYECGRTAQLEALLNDTFQSMLEKTREALPRSSKEITKPESHQTQSEASDNLQLSHSGLWIALNGDKGAVKKLHQQPQKSFLFCGCWCTFFFTAPYGDTHICTHIYMSEDSIAAFDQNYTITNANFELISWLLTFDINFRMTVPAQLCKLQQFNHYCMARRHPAVHQKEPPQWLCTITFLLLNINFSSSAQSHCLGNISPNTDDRVWLWKLLERFGQTLSSDFTN